MEIFEAADAKGAVFKVYPRTENAHRALQNLVKFLEERGLPFFVGSRPEAPSLLLTLGPVDDLQREAVIAHWGTYLVSSPDPSRPDVARETGSA